MHFTCLYIEERLKKQSQSWKTTIYNYLQKQSLRDSTNRSDHQPLEQTIDLLTLKPLYAVYYPGSRESVLQVHAHPHIFSRNSKNK